MRIEYILLIGSLLFVLSVAASKLAVRLGIPALLLFAAIGMLAGSDGPGGIYFDYPWATQFVGIAALALILFAAGFETDVAEIRPVLWQGLSLATLGVLLSAVFFGLFASWLLHMRLIEGLLIGSIVSSTDAAAVFNVLRARNLELKGHLKALVELESGSNDPMAVLLTIVFIQLVSSPAPRTGEIIWLMVKQAGIGAVSGYVLGKLIAITINRFRLEWEGLYPVLSVAMALLTYAATALLGGSGFVAVYLAGIVVGRGSLIHRSTLRVFHDGIAWLLQIAMFVVLGLQVFPSRLPGVAAVGLAMSFFLMLVARPASVFLASAPFRIPLREKLFVSWAGLRGAAPIILATFPLVAGLPRSELIFNIVFFVALTSLLLQGTTVPLAAKLLDLRAAPVKRRVFPLQFNPTVGTDSQLLHIQVAPGSVADGRTVMDLQLPRGVLIALLERESNFVVPEGGTILRGGDAVSILVPRSLQEPIVKMMQEPNGASASATMQDE